MILCNLYIASIKIQIVIPQIIKIELSAPKISALIKPKVYSLLAFLAE